MNGSGKNVKSLGKNSERKYESQGNSMSDFELLGKLALDQEMYTILKSNFGEAFIECRLPIYWMVW